MKKLFLLPGLLMLALTAFTQKQADWTKDFPSGINWYRVSDAGVLLVASKDGLYGLDGQGKEVWKADDIENIKEDNAEDIPGTPYLVLVKQSLMKGYNKIVDVVTGKTVVNTNDLGFQTVAKRLYLPKSNAMIFYGGKAGKQVLTYVDLSTGKKVWEQEKILGKIADQIVSEAGDFGDGVFLATNKNIYKLNKANGEVIYSLEMKSDLPVAAPSGKQGLGSIKNPWNFDKGSNEQMTMTAADFFQSPNDASTIYFWNQDLLTGLDIATGKEKIARVNLPSPIAYLLHDSRGFLIATSEKRQEDIAKSSNKGLMGKIASSKDRASLLLIDPATGNEKWNSDVELKGDVLAYRMTGNKLILGTQQDDGDNYISIVDLDKGNGVTKKPLRIKGTIQDLQLMPQGLYFRTTDQLNILDLESGEKNWKKGFSVKNCIGYNESDKLGYVGANGIIYKVDFVNGEMNEWLTNLNFDKSEEPSTIHILDDKVFVAGQQNASLYSRDGQQIYHTYVEAPGRTLTGKILSGIGGVASLAAGTAAAAQTAQLSFAKGYYGSTDPGLDSRIKNSQNLATAGFSGAVASFQSINKRFNATQQAQNIMAILTKFGSNEGKDAGITILDKSNGKRVADMLLGDKKDPDYMIDDLGRMVYYRSGGKVIEGFSY